MYPYVLLKSVIISKALRVNVGIPIHLQMPPMVLRNFIRKQSAEDIILVFMGEDKVCATYWLAGIINNSYLGSLILKLSMNLNLLNPADSVRILTMLTKIVMGSSTNVNSPDYFMQ